MQCSFYPLAPPSRLFSIACGTPGKRRTLGVMGRLVRTYKKDTGVRRLSQELTRHLPSYDSIGEVRALHGFVRDRIRFVDDIEDTETVQIPPYTLSVGSGDCDCKCTLLNAMLASIGYRTCFFAIGFNGGDIEHVLSGVYLGTRCLPLEVVIPAHSEGPGSALPGWMPPDADPILPWNV